MVQDFTKVGIPQEPEERDPLTDVVRSGIKPPMGREGLRLGIQKLTGTVPLGVDAPTKGLRKFIGGGWELLSFLKFGFLAVVFLVVGVAFCYFGAEGQHFGLKMVGLASLALCAVLARFAFHAARNLRSIAKA